MGIKGHSTPEGQSVSQKSCVHVDTIPMDVTPIVI